MFRKDFRSLDNMKYCIKIQRKTNMIHNVKGGSIIEKIRLTIEEMISTYQTSNKPVNKNVYY